MVVASCAPSVVQDVSGEDAGTVDVVRDVDESIDVSSPDVEIPDVSVPDELNAYWNAFDFDARDGALVSALHEKLSSTHNRVSFDRLFDSFGELHGGQPGCEDGVFDFYSSNCWVPEDDRCGQYRDEGDCYNREHTWPKSWWGGGEGRDAHSDVFSVLPSDGFVNGQRASLPYGVVQSAAFTSENGSKRGRCEHADECFEPIDSVKGDIARIYFYLAVRYEGEFTCCDEESVNGADIDEWQEELLRTWHLEDPVSEGERGWSHGETKQLSKGFINAQNHQTVSNRYPCARTCLSVSCGL